MLFAGFVRLNHFYRSFRQTLLVSSSKKLFHLLKGDGILLLEIVLSSQFLISPNSVRVTI